MLNKAILMGRLTRDPELRHTQSNMAVCSFSLAIDRGRKDQNGERQTDFIDCVAWGRQAEFVAQWFTKGSMAIVVGRIQSCDATSAGSMITVSSEANAAVVMDSAVAPVRKNERTFLKVIVCSSFRGKLAKMYFLRLYDYTTGCAFCV